MNVQEMHNQIRGALLENNTPEYDLLDDALIDNALNVVVNRFVKQRLSKRSNPKQLGFEDTLKRYSDLQTLIKTTPLQVGENDTLSDFVTLALPQNFWFYVAGKSNCLMNPFGGIPEESSSLVTVPIKVIEHDYLESLGKNPFISNTTEYIPSLLEDNKIRLFLDKKAILKEIYLTYICKPNKISLSLYQENPKNGNCDLPEQAHQEIVDKAVEYILEEVQARRYQSKRIDNAEIE